MYKPVETARPAGDRAAGWAIQIDELDAVYSQGRVERVEGLPTLVRPGKNRA